MNTKFRYLSFFILLILSFQLAGCFNNDKDESQKGVSSSRLLKKLNKPFSAPDTALMDMDGKLHKLSDYRGKPVIVNFWATWCPPCREELPSMNRAWAKVKTEGIEMLAVNMGEDEDTIFPFTGEYPIDFTILLDKDGQFALDWQVKGLPTTYVVDPGGLVVYQAVGGREWDDDAILDSVRELKVQE